jgi:hypothetical protein
VERGGGNQDATINMAQTVSCFFPNVERNKKDEPRRTSSRIFFHMIRVISSPSSSTTGFFTTIFSPNSHQISWGVKGDAGWVGKRSAKSWTRDEKRRIRITGLTLTVRRHAARKTSPVDRRRRHCRRHEWGKVRWSSREPAPANDGA